MSKEQDVKDLIGQSRAVIMNHHLSGEIVDPKWAAAIGQRIMFDGGTELRVDDIVLNQMIQDSKGTLSAEDNPMLPIIIRDEYYPPVDVIIPYFEFVKYTTPVKAGSSKRYGVTPEECEHGKQKQAGCLSCYRKWWRAVAVVRKLL